MKLWFSLILCIGTTFAASIDLYNVGGGSASHYDQHSQSVDAGRRSVAQRLGSSASSTGYVDCGACLQQQTAAFDAESLDTGLGHGVGVVGLSGGSSDLSSSSLHTSSSTQQLQPLYLSPNTGSLSSALTASHHITNSQPTGVYIPVGGGGGSENYQRHYEKHVTSNAAPIVLAPTTGGGSESYQRHYEKRVQANAAPIVLAPSGGSERYQQHIEKRLQSSSAPLVITPSGGSESFQRLEKRIQTNSAIPVIAPQTGGSESFHQSQRIVKTSAAAPVYIPQPSGSESYHHESQRIVKANSATPILVNPVSGGSEYSSQFSQNLVKSQQAVPVHVYSPSSSSVYSHEAQHSSNALTGGTVIPVSHGGSSSFLESSNAHSTHGSLLTPHYSSVGTGLGSSHLSAGLGTSHLSTGSDLDYYRSESERLAKLQAQSINQGGVRAGSSVLDSGISTGSRIGTGGGSGNYRSQSWEKSSKWASGTELGPEGRPKNYNLLSTAESEQHNLNGKSAGFKAATTTLDDDGKVSTYSIHTP